MYELCDENEIKDNLLFFSKVAHLVTNKTIQLCVYKDLANRLVQRTIHPFPIYLGKIKDEDLKARIKDINSLFDSIIMKRLMPVDLGVCSGNQDYIVESLLEQTVTLFSDDEHYIELAHVLLSVCYDSCCSIEPLIITGVKEKGLRIDNDFRIKCNCAVKQYLCDYRLISIDELLSESDIAFMELSEMVVKSKLIFVESPTIVRGEHHNKLQKDSNFTTYAGFSRRNKTVIRYLRNFGLERIVFGEFHEDASKAVGTIVAVYVRETERYDIVEGWLFAETGYRNHVDLYFPPRIGNALIKYMNEEISVNKITRLIDSLAL